MENFSSQSSFDPVHKTALYRINAKHIELLRSLFDNALEDAHIINSETHWIFGYINGEDVRYFIARIQDLEKFRRMTPNAAELMLTLSLTDGELFADNCAVRIRCKEMEPDPNLLRRYSAKWHVIAPLFQRGWWGRNVNVANKYALGANGANANTCWFSLDKNRIQAAKDFDLDWFFDIALPLKNDNGYPSPWVRKVFQIPANKLYEIICTYHLGINGYGLYSVYINPKNGMMYADINQNHPIMEEHMIESHLEEIVYTELDL